MGTFGYDIVLISYRYCINTIPNTFRTALEGRKDKMKGGREGIQEGKKELKEGRKKGREGGREAGKKGK